MHSGKIFVQITLNTHMQKHFKMIVFFGEHWFLYNQILLSDTTLPILNQHALAKFGIVNWHSESLTALGLECIYSSTFPTVPSRSSLQAHLSLSFIWEITALIGVGRECHSAHWPASSRGSAPWDSPELLLLSQ